MDKIIAYCGLVCTDCGAFLAARNNDDALRRKTAEEWTAKYHFPFKPEDINCVGCIAVEGAHVGHCAMCEIRQCGQAKGVRNCGWCAAYPCARMEDFFKMAPQVKKTLDAVRQR